MHQPITDNDGEMRALLAAAIADAKKLHDELSDVAREVAKLQAELAD
jgi:hypothetical protein